jgi:hypothetical protein
MECLSGYIESSGIATANHGYSIWAWPELLALMHACGLHVQARRLHHKARRVFQMNDHSSASCGLHEGEVL